MNNVKEDTKCPKCLKEGVQHFFDNYYCRTRECRVREFGTS